ncbi:hypothetical protein VP01_2527g10 [Puccinia sorghi]|uniref:Uncharacterized protein n=1 Tax=Puccinia sorghi TaxID=27349 RepID=A0A0L6V636_9BASI|nr:hypothetical protein VP01_2527g8 [Puccinia sorghi]KNZ55992.1 hypothetical protein VP01_2527g10 [Puccinia sorghi]
MEAYRADQEQLCLCKEQDQLMVNLIKDQKKQARSRPKSKNLSTPSTSQSLPDDSNDRGKPFNPKDYEHLFTSLEEGKNYTSLFGYGSKTAIGVKQMTKSQSYEFFSTWMNQLNTDLHINGRRLQQWINRGEKYIY